MFDLEEKTIKITALVIKMGDVEDPDLYIAEPIYEWQQTEEGKWIMEHSKPEPSWFRHIDHHTYGYRYSITAYLKPKDYTYWSLKYK